MINSDEIKQFLERQMKIRSEKEFLDLLFQMLEENPSKEMRDLLKPYLVTYSSVDRNRVADYLIQFLSDPDPLERQFVVGELLSLALKPEDDAYKKLSEFLGEEPTRENRKRIMAKRWEELNQLGMDE